MGRGSCLPRVRVPNIKNKEEDQDQAHPRAVPLHNAGLEETGDGPVVLPLQLIINHQEIKEDAHRHKYCV